MSHPESEPPAQPDPYRPAQTPTGDAVQGYPQPPAGYQQPYSPGAYPPGYPPLIRPTSGMATASLVFGIAGVFLFCLVIPSLVAVFCGHEAIKETKGGHKAGHGQAVAGLILGYVVAIPAALWLVLGGFGSIMSAIENR